MILPGTHIDTGGITEPEKCLDMIFISGGQTLSQITTLSNLEGYDVQNWIKRGFSSPGKGKKYTKRQFCRFVIINILKDTLPIGSIVSLLSYVNGRLDDESDDTIPDDMLYCLFVKTLELSDSETNELLFRFGNEKLENGGDINRVGAVLSIMKNAYISSFYKRKALDELKKLTDTQH